MSKKKIKNRFEREMSGSYNYLQAKTVISTDTVVANPTGQGVVLSPSVFGGQSDATASIAPYSPVAGLAFYSSATLAGWPNGTSVAGSNGMDFGTVPVNLPPGLYLWSDVSSNNSSSGQVTITWKVRDHNNNIVNSGTFLEDQYNAVAFTQGNNVFMFRVPELGSSLPVTFNLTTTGKNGASSAYNVGWLTPFYINYLGA
jgi:hypothetical protein